jgi:hypothetical protein
MLVVYEQRVACIFEDLHQLSEECFAKSCFEIQAAAHRYKERAYLSSPGLV